MIDKSRLLAITDGIIAVAATVMVLKLEVPEHASFKAIIEQLPIIEAYIISYTQIFLAWHEHHDIFAKAEKINHRVFLLNCLWLFFITLLPFITGVAGESTMSVIIYLLIMTAQIVVLHLECDYIEKLNDITMQDAKIVGLIRKITYIALVFAFAGTFIMPLIGMAIIVAASIASVVLLVVNDED